MGGYVPIDQNEVPESQHTVFIRGFPGDLSTDRVKSYIDEKVGRCSFDFVKQSPDKSRLFVAVRFDSRDVAREFMRDFNGAEVLGFPVELTWFKDIRRYVSYQQSQGSSRTFQSPSHGSSRNLPAPPRGAGGGGGGMMSRGRPPLRGAPYAPRGSYVPRGGRGSFYNPRGGFDSYRGGRPPMRGSYNGRGGMISRTISNRRSRSPSRSSGSYHSRSRSRSRSRRTPSHSPSRSHSRSPSPVRRTPVSPEPRKSRSKSPEQSKKLAKKIKKHKKKHRKRSESRSSGEISDNDDPDQPKMKRIKRRRSESPLESENGSIATSRASAPIGVRQSPTVIKIEARSTHRQVTLDQPDLAKMNGGADSDRPESAISSNPADGVLSELRLIQNSILASVKTEEKDRKIAALAPPKKKEGFKLSSFTKQISAESEREKKVSQLSPEKVEQLNVKRKDLELAYKQDCETFGTVVKMLISKDPALEDRLLASLRESLKDIGSKFVTELDEYIDELLAN